MDDRDEDGKGDAIHPILADTAGIDKAIEVLERGGTMVYPTDTLYGLGASIRFGDAVHRTFVLKRMEPSPQSLVMADHEMAGTYVDLSPALKQFLSIFPAGPFTLLASVRKDARELIPPVLIRDSRIGIRFPLHSFPRTVARRTGPITSTSANHHGEQPPKAINEVRLTGVDIYVDGGPCFYAGPSTIISEEGDSLVIKRQGTLNEDVIRHYLGDLFGK
jgi:L-threonylcarbamoyladenylate synthase